MIVWTLTYAVSKMWSAFFANTGMPSDCSVR